MSFSSFFSRLVEEGRSLPLFLQRFHVESAGQSGAYTGLDHNFRSRMPDGRIQNPGKAHCSTSSPKNIQLVLDGRQGLGIDLSLIADCFAPTKAQKSVVRQVLQPFFPFARYVIAANGSFKP